MKPGERLSGIALACAALAIAVLPAAAQTGAIEVRVFDSSGRDPVAGAAVTVSSTVGYVPSSTVSTGKDGVASFPVLRPGGGYVVEVALAGFARFRMREVRVKIGEVNRVPVRLVPEIEERVKVVERRAQTDLEETSRTTTLDESFLQDLPSQGRFYTTMLNLAPGVIDADGDGNPNVHGARAADFQTQVGGVSNQDPLTGGWMSYLNADAIEEMTVIGAGAGVEYGRAQGGFAQVIQKQGSNDFEGLFNVLWRSSLMDGDATVVTQGTVVPDYDWLQPAIQVSGPIVKDRIWYRLSHEYISREEPIPTLEGAVVAARRQGIHSDQITWQASSRSKLAFEFRSDPLTLTNVGANALTAPDSTRRFEGGGPTYSLTWTAAVSPSVLADTVVSYQLGHQNTLPTTSTALNDCTAAFVSPTTGDPYFPALATAQCLTTGTGVTSGSYAWTSRDDRERLAIKSHASVYAGRFLGMSHQFKAGFNVENERYFRDLEKRAQVTLSVEKLQTTVIDETGRRRRPEVGTLGIQIASPPTSQSKATNTSYGIFLEDQIKPLSNLSLTLGLRVDREELNGIGWKPFDPMAESEEFLNLVNSGLADAYTAASGVFTVYGALDRLIEGASMATGLPVWFLEPRFSPGLAGSQDWPNHRDPEEIAIRNTNPAPRFALAWDPEGKGKSKLAFTAGRYYGATFLAVPFVELEPVTLEMSVVAQRYAGEEAWREINIWGGINPMISIRTVDHDLRTPFQDELTLSYEREIAPETTARVALISRRFQDQFQDVDTNHHSGDYGRCNPQLRFRDRWLIPPPDGVADDCEGVFDADGLRASDGFIDAYVYNPGWGTVYRVGNENEASYEAIVLEVVRRQYRNWQMQASYTWSRAFGDAEEFSSYLGDDPTLRDAESGYLAYDQTHVIKVNTTTITPWGFRWGMAASWMSGLPYSILQFGTSYDSIPPDYPPLFYGGSRTRTQYPTGHRNDHRNRPALKLDMKFDKEINLKGGQNLQVSLEVFNLLNDRYYQIYNPQLGYGRQLNGRNDSTITPGRQFQVGLRLAF